MQKKIPALLLTLGWLLCGWASHAQNQNNCNLPATANIQFNQMNSTTLNAFWSPVAGAVAYWAVLENLSNNSQSAQAKNPVGPAAMFVVIPGNAYRLKVWAQCAGPNGTRTTSPNFGQKDYKADYIVIDLIADRGNCTPLPSGPGLITLTEFNPKAQLPDFPTTDPDIYYATFSHSSLPEPPKFQIKYENGQFYLKGVGTAVEGEELLGLPASGFSPVYIPPPVLASAVKATYNSGQTVMNVSFALPREIHFNGTSGSSLTIYQASCSNGFSPGNNEGDDPITPTIDPVAQATLKNIQVVNPFSSDLTLLFQEHPTQPVTAQLCDVSGRMQLQQTIEPGSIAGNQYKLVTADLQPGMYFLRLGTAPGVFSTHKVVKYDQR